jgi:HPt (histidine-containing phosphotransfer) domain-containing protein
MGASKDHPAAPSRGFATNSPIDLTDLQKLGGDDGNIAGSSDFVHDIIELFLDLAPKIYEDSVAAVADGDGASMARACHKLRSQAAYFGAQRLVQVCQQLEEIGLANDMGRAESGVHDLEDELDRVSAALQPHRKQL